MNDTELTKLLYSLAGKIDTDSSYVIERVGGKVRSSLESELSGFDKVTIYPRADVLEFDKNLLLARIGEAGIEEFKNTKSVKIKKQTNYKVLKTANGISKKQANVWFTVEPKGYDCSVEKALEYLLRYPEILTLNEGEAAKNDNDKEIKSKK